MNKKIMKVLYVNIAPQVKMLDSDWWTAGEHSICCPPLSQCYPARWGMLSLPIT